MRLLWRLVKLLTPYKWWMLLGIFLSSLTLLANIVLMGVSGWFITSMALAGLAEVSMNYFSPAALIRAAAIIRTAGRYAERLVSHEATFRVLASIRIWFYQRLEPLVPEIIENYHGGDLFSRIRADIDSLDNFYIRVLIPLCVALIVMLIVFAFVAQYSFLLAMVILSNLIFAGLIIPLLLVKFGEKPGQALVELGTKMRISCVDGIQGLAELTVLGALEQQAEELKREGRALVKTQEHLAKLSSFGTASNLFFSNLAMWLILLFGIPLVSQHELAPAEFVMLILLTLAAFEAVIPLSGAFHLLGQIKTAAMRLFEIVDQKSRITEPFVGQQKPDEFIWQLKSVNFSYCPSPPAINRELNDRPFILNDINFNLTPGKKIAIIGASGTGKSSLMQLLLRQRQPQSGTILLSGHTLEQYRSEDIRSWISIVPQKPYLFNRSILENLKLAKPDATTLEIEQVMAISQLSDFVHSQAEGLQTWVGETGVKLSGGQIKKIAIARALLKPHQLLILDEPSEGLDQQTSAILMENIIHSLEQRALILITHQLSGLEQFDEILLMDNGTIMDRGDYTKLIKQGL
jgi:ATP-binding cassette subfamily C protein CydC